MFSGDIKLGAEQIHVVTRMGSICWANLNGLVTLLLAPLPLDKEALWRPKPQEEEEHFGWSGKSTGLGVSDLGSSPALPPLKDSPVTMELSLGKCLLITS